MKPGLFQQLTLYRYRYAVGYTLLILFGVVMLTWQLRTLGPGLANPEKMSALASATWQWEHWKDAGLQIVNLPYILLQKASISVMGLSVLSVRLPSVLIGLITSTLFFFLMRSLHKSHIALASSILFAAGSWYIAMGRFGAPLVMVPFIWVLMTYSFVRLIRLDDPPLAWAALGGLAAALALYTPYGIYAILSAAFIVAIHPKIRRSLGAISGPQVVLALFLLVPLVIPLGWGLYNEPKQAWDLVGLSSQTPAPLDFVKNIGHALLALGWKAPEWPALRLADLPLLSIGVTALFVAGLYRAIRDWRSMRTQFILFSLLIMLFVQGLKPDPSFAGLLVPVFLLIAAGVSVLFHEWYRLFPRNPYARSFGLIPIVVLLGFIVVYHFQRYFVAWANAPQTYYTYNDDITLVREQLARRPNTAMQVPDKDAEFYKVLVRKYPNATVNIAPRADQSVLVSADSTVGAPGIDAKPVVNDDAKDALRFWLISR